MSYYNQLSLVDLKELQATLEHEADQLKAQGLALDMSRGKPSVAQTDLARPFLDLINSSSELTDDGVRVDNYGGPDGLPHARALIAQLIGTTPELVSAIGSSSLNLEHDCIAHAYTHGICGNTPWSQLDEAPRFICLVPGYDRHFAITEYYGINNIALPFAEDGQPPLDAIKELVEHDARVKGIWCVPRFSNPTGVTYSQKTVDALAALEPAAPDFRIYWDNAYAFHAFKDDAPELPNLFDALAAAHHEDMAYVFGSFAKVTFPGSGLAWLAASPANMADMRRAFSIMRVGPEKISQLMHVLAFKSPADVAHHMELQARELAPRFELVETELTRELEALDVATWTHPAGGYFVSFECKGFSAKAVVARAKELGVTLTGAGATWTGGIDPYDTNIRLAPTYPTLKELEQALRVFCLAVKLEAVQAALHMQQLRNN